MGMSGGFERNALIDVLKGGAPERRPIWFMRQAGRYLPEYRKVRETAGSFLRLCYAPELAAEVTVQPLRRYDLDAAIVFADILVVPHAMGLTLDFREGEGPQLQTARTLDEVEALSSVAGTWQVGAIEQTLKRVKAELGNRCPLFGFCGAPWTVASYMIEGGGSDERQLSKHAMFQRQPWFLRLIERLTEESILYLARQCAAGADVLQIFDSWAGDVPGPLQREFVITPMVMIAQGLRAKGYTQPVIAFGRGLGAGHLDLARSGGFAAVSLETAVAPGWAAAALCPVTPVQGNLDPLAMTAGETALASAVDAIVEHIPQNRHIFNLGHGIRQETQPEALQFVIDRVRAADVRS